MLERAERGTVARVAGVQGIHRARPRAPRGQDHGFGYLVASLVEALRADRPFTVWESPAINTLATPTLATGAAELIWLALEREVTGVLHCCGGEHVDRVGLARRAAAAFELDPGLVRTGPPPEPPARPVPYDTRLDAHRHGGRARRRAARPGHPAGAAAPRDGGRDVQYDLITMGRVGVDLYPEQIGVPLADVRTFAKSLGGSPTNVAVAAARLGARAAVITKVGDDPFGPYIRSALRGFGVDDAFVGTHPTLRTPVVFCEIFPPDDFPLLFYREPQAPDMTIAADELDLDAIREARVFWTTGTGLSAEPSRAATLAALEARSEVRGVTIHDLDHRPMFWAEGDDAGEHARARARARDRRGRQPRRGGGGGRHARARRGGRGAARARRPARGRQARDRRGRSRARATSGSRSRRCRSRSSAASAPATRSAARSCTGCWRGWPLERTIRLANAAGAHVAGQLACADAMPTLHDLEGARV